MATKSRTRSGRSRPRFNFAREQHLAGSSELHAYFNRRVQEILKKHSKTMIGWDEVRRPGLRRTGDSILAGANQRMRPPGYRGILSAGYYGPSLPTSQRTSGPRRWRAVGGEACA
jgi:hypothetical protein